MNSKFRVNSYELQAQRHVYPLYMADGRGGYEFSSTMTFVKSKNESFCVFAAHAIHPRADGMDQIGVPKRDGVFTPSQRFDCGVVLNIMPEFKRSGRVE